MSMATHILHLTTAALLSAGVATAQSARPVAFTNARIHTVSGAVVERGTLVVRSGKIEAVGADVTIPAGAKRVDATGKTIMPGLVSAWSRAGMSRPTPRSNTPTRRGRRSRGPRMPTSRGGRASNQAATRVVDGLYTRQNISDIDRDFGGSLENTFRETGARLNFRSVVFPTNVQIFRREIEQEDRSIDQDFDIQQDTIQADGRIWVVSVVSGAMAFTRMPSRPSSRARLLVKPSMASLKEA